jgi:O-acetyl-ADP-ribose deacetylase (regulator of RNase III)
VIFVGLQGSGKSTFYRTHFADSHVLVSRDSFPNNRNPARRQRQLIEEALGAGRSVIVDNTNPTLEDRAELISLARAFGATVVAYYFESRLADCLERNRQRPGKASVPVVALYATRKRVQHSILDQFFGEQPVGTAFVLATNHSDVPFLAHAPTMRVPGNIEGTDKVYAATWSALLAVHAHNLANDRKIEVLAFPAMGTGFGGVPFREAARQMAAAYRHYLEPPHRLDWDFVVERHKAVCYDGSKQVAR